MRYAPYKKERIKNRKFFITLILIISSTMLLIGNYILASHWLNAILLISSAYLGANVIDKKINRQND